MCMKERERVKKLEDRGVMFNITPDKISIYND